MGQIRLAAVLALAIAAAACTGHTLAEVRPGQGRYIQTGAIAVDSRTDTAFVLRPGAGGKVLYAVRPDGSTSRVAELAGRDDIRVVFPASGVLVMSELDKRDRLQLFDARTLAPIRTVEREASYHGTRMSPSKRWLAVADSNKKTAAIHIVDTESLATHVIPHDGFWLEAMWMSKTDQLVAIVFYRSKAGRMSARVLSWSMATVAAAGFKATKSGFWPKPEYDLKLEDVAPDLLFSFTWVGISPDDRSAVLPVCRAIPLRSKRKSSGGPGYSCEHQLLVLDTTSGGIRRVDNAMGPVGFTADGAKIVSYRTGRSEKKQGLLVVDAETLETSQIEVPIAGGLSFFVTHEGNYVVAAASDGKSALALVDLDNGKVRPLGATPLGFQEFVTRAGYSELWMVFEAKLYRLDLGRGTLEPVPIGISPSHINLLPGKGWLILDDKQSNRLFFFDPATRKSVRTVIMP